MITLSTASFYERTSTQLANLRKQAEDLQSKIPTGERLSRSSDDPVAAARLRELSRKTQLSAVDQASSDRAATDLKLVDQALGSLANIVISVRELAIHAASETVSDSQRQAMAAEIAGLGESLFTLANARGASGQPLFGGHTPGAAYELQGGVVTYAGTPSAAETELGDGQTVATGLPGPQLFDFTVNGAPTDLFATLATLAAGLQAGGAAASAAASDALSALDAGLDKVTTSQTIVGARLAFIEDVNDRRTTTGELTAEEQARMGGLDIAATITRLQETMTVLEASQASFVRLSSLSLFSLLR